VARNALILSTHACRAPSYGSPELLDALLELLLLAFELLAFELLLALEPALPAPPTPLLLLTLDVEPF
jgi:hypothetical protein